MTSTVWQELSLRLVVARDLDSECLGIGCVSLHSSTGDHSQTLRKGLDFVAFEKVVGSSTAEDGLDRSFFGLVVEVTRCQQTLPHRQKKRRRERWKWVCFGRERRRVMEMLRLTVPSNLTCHRR